MTDDTSKVEHAFTQRHIQLILANLTGLTRGFLETDQDFLIHNQAVSGLITHLLNELGQAVATGREEELMQNWITQLPTFQDKVFQAARGRRPVIIEGTELPILMQAEMDNVIHEICPPGPQDYNELRVRVPPGWSEKPPSENLVIDLTTEEGSRWRDTLLEQLLRNRGRGTGAE